MVLLESVIVNGNFTARNILDDVHNFLTKNGITKPDYDTILDILITYNIKGEKLVKFYDAICYADEFNFYRNIMVLSLGDYNIEEVSANLERDIPINFISDDVVLDSFKEYSLDYNKDNIEAIKYSLLQHENFESRNIEPEKGKAANM